MPARSVTKSILPVLLCLALAGCFKSSEERAAEHFQNGLSLLEAGDPDRALVEFRNTLKFNQTNMEARRQIALINIERGRKTGAYRQFLAITEQNPDDLEGRVTLGELAFDLGDWGEFERHGGRAVTLAEAATDLAPEMAERVAAINLARQYRDATVEEDAPARATLLAEAETQQQALPDNLLLRRILISGYIETGKYDAALAQLDTAIEAEPNVLANYGARLDLLVRQKDEAAIEAELYRMVERFPEDENVQSTFLRYLTSRGKTDQAESYLREQVAAKTGAEKQQALSTLVGFVLNVRGNEAALAEVNAAFDANPTDQLRVLRASLTFDQGDQDTAIRQLEELIREEETQLSTVEAQEAKVLLARMLLKSGNEVGARQRVEEVLTADPNAPAALKLRTYWQIREDDTEGAINGLRVALAANPEDSEAMELMAEAHERAGSKSQKLSFLAQAVEATNNAPRQSLNYARALMEDGNDLQAETTLIDSLRVTPGTVEVLTLLGQVYLRLEDAGRARQVAETLRNIEEPRAQDMAKALEIEIVAKLDGKEEALRMLETLADTAEGAVGDQAKLSLIRERLRSGDVTGGLDYAKELVANEPDNTRFRYALSLIYMALGQVPEAEEGLRQLLVDSPEDPQIWLQLARIEASRTDATGALAVIDEGLEKLPGAPDLLWGKASLLQGRGDIDGAIEIFEGLYTDNSESLIVANNLASLLATYRKDDPESVARATRIARRLVDTNVPAFQDTYGWIAHLDGRSEEAVTYLEPAAAGLPGDVAVQIHLGLVYAALGRDEEALAQLQKALSTGGPLSGNEALLEEARAKIAELQAGPEENVPSEQAPQE